MGFWNALSVLAPVAPALSDARDIRTQREQDAAKFAQDSELKKAQTTVEQFAGQEAQQRLIQGKAPIQIPGTKDYYSAADGSMMRPSLVNGEFKAVKIPGQAPADELKQATKGLKDAFDAMGVTLPPNVLADLGYRIYGGTGAFPSTASSMYRSIPGAAGLPQNPSGDGKTWVRPMFDPSTNQTVEVPIQDYKPVAKTPTNDTRFIAITGRPQSTWTPEESEFVQGYKNMVNTKTTEPGVARMNALSQNRIVTPIDPNDPSAEIYTTAGQAMRQGLNAPGSIDYRLQMPTGAERGRADLAMSAREQLTDMESILRTRSDLFGPVAGKVTNVTQWLGSQDPDAQRFQAAARIAADHLAGVFGGRSQAALEAIYQLVGRNATNPAAAIAGIEQLDKAASRIQSRGVGPKGADGAGSGGAKTYKQTATGSGNPKIGSNDGGNTWYDVQTGKKVQ